ncbi:uncharacterized protein [Gossypium hirsutum]|uniref:Uncharacterized protein isoform X1 n=1 Tax=Gossypium hirsutum TaxID=3635 RepID=A0ABM3BNR1_GOSHI|nr:uncharacterized protein LOC107916901 isoform X1 [Gossypium hirsutum]
MTACRHAFDSAVVRSPVLPIGTSCCILFTKGNDKTASTCSPSRVGSQASFQIFVDSPFLILQLVPSSSELCAFQMLCLVKEGSLELDEGQDALEELFLFVVQEFISFFTLFLIVLVISIFWRYRIM